MSTIATQPHNIQTSLNFFKPNEDGSAPSPAFIARPETFERVPDTQQVTIQDVSANIERYNLATHGFQFVTFPCEERDFTDPGRVEKVYYKEVDQLLKDMTGATRVLIFDHTIRRPNKKQANETEGSSAISHDLEKQSPASIGPTYSVHVDQSYESALSRVSFHLPEEAEKLLKGRVQLINVWRPLKTVRRDPLAVAPSYCIAEDDLVPIPVVYPHGYRTGATLQVKYNDREEWYYKWHQTPDEIVVFKCFDNRAGPGSAEKYADRAKRVPHSAFEIPGAGAEEERESIEVRCLVFHEQDVQ